MSETQHSIRRQWLALAIVLVCVVMLALTCRYARPIGEAPQLSQDQDIESWDVYVRATNMLTTYVSTPAANTAAQVVVAALGAGKQTAIHHLAVSMNKTPGEGTYVQLASASGTMFKGYLSAGGPANWAFAPAIAFPANEPVTATLSAGGSGVTGTLWIQVETR
jgi:hypothetical protein